MSLKALGLLVVILTCLQGVMGQDLGTLSGANLSSISVDDLSDEQLQNLLDRAQASGYSQSQLEVLARARGMSEPQIAKLRGRISRLESTELVESQEIQRVRQSPEGSTTVLDPFKSIAPVYLARTQSKIFGRDIFNNPNISFEPSYNTPTPENYLLGPGDELIIDVWGASEQTYQLQISPEGSIRIPNLGPVYLNGLTIQSARTRLLRRLKQIYSSLGENTFAEISLGQLKTIRVNVVGEVSVPGTYAMGSFSTVYTALYRAGGPAEDGTVRRVEVYRDGIKVEEIDLFEYLFDGKSSDQVLRDQDLILVKPYGIRASITGKVKRPMIYELKENETLDDLIRYAGGFGEEAFESEVTINRVDGIRRKILTVNSSDFNTTALTNGDEVIVGGIVDEFENRVVIKGAIYRPGAYELKDNFTLSALINKAEGVKPDAFRGRGLIWRQNSDNTLKNISFRLDEVADGRWDIELSPNDSIMIQSIFDLEESLNITVRGEVRSPGSIQYVDSLTVEDVIFLSGGFTEFAAKSSVEVSRRLKEESEETKLSSEIFNFLVDESLSLSETASTFKLEPRDIVVVRKSPFYQRQEMVEIEGEVRFPGVYALERNDERISDLLKRAGGLSFEAYPKGATLIRRTEYFATDDDDADVATRIRRESLGAILRRDTLVSEGQAAFRAQESIGIDLVKIIGDPGSNYDLILKKGDVLSIPRELQTVRVRGEVLYPSTIKFDGSGGLRNYLSRAGGITDNAKLGKSYVVYANGSAAKTRRFFWFKGFPRIAPGAEIIVPQRPERRRLNAQEILGISSSLLSMVLIIDRLSN